jgi:hypothetical protein
MMQLCESLTNALPISRREIKANAVLLRIFIVSSVRRSSLFRIRSRTLVIRLHYLPTPAGMPPGDTGDTGDTQTITHDATLGVATTPSE